MREPIIPQLAEREFLIWEAAQAAKFELHHGFVVAFAGGTLDHDQISRNVCVEFERLFPAPCRVFGTDVKVRVTSDLYYYADAGVVCDDVTGGTTLIERPHIVAEVLSPSTRAYDLIEKRAAYRSLATLRAYVIVHTAFRRVEVDERGLGGVWNTQTYDVGEAFVNGRVTALDAIYARSSLEER
jgi:Uma2 family endonuclease